MTPHYKLDWPNSVPLKELHVNPQIINRQMTSIMKGEKLAYAITERENGKFIKIIEITMKNQIAYINSTGLDPEIMQYLHDFLSQNFGTKKILALA